MFTKETKKITIAFDDSDMVTIKDLVKEQAGTVTIAEIFDNMSYVFNWYKALMTMTSKISTGWYVDLDHDEINVLVSLLSKGYNSENKTEAEKEEIKKIADAVDMLRK